MNTKRARLTTAIMLAVFLAAVEGTIVTMATPTITKDLNGFSWVSLVFSVYLLTSAISTPIYGKLSDLYGRKRMLSIGIIIFLTGSSLCGLSQNIGMLIGFRALQGLGAGSILTISYTVIGDVYALEQRTKVQGSLNMIWGIASLIGPFLGGFLIDTLSWHWIFYINIPFGLLSIILLQGALEEKFEKKKHRIDYTGTVVLSLAMVLLLSIFLFDQNTIPYYNWFAVLAAVAAVVLLFAFYKIERRVKEPIVSFDIFTRTSVMVNLITFLVYAVLIGINVYMPIYLQNVLAFRPTASGLAMLPMSISWFLIAFILGKLLKKYGEKRVTMGMGSVILIGTVLLTTLGVDSSVLFVLIYGFIIGIGFGGISTTLTVMVQESVDYSRRGTAVAANSLLKTLGQTIGISVFGSLFNTGITRYFADRGITGINPTDLYQSSASQGAISAKDAALSLSSSLHTLFLVLVFISCLSLILSAFMPKPPAKG